MVDSKLSTAPFLRQKIEKEDFLNLCHCQRHFICFNNPSWQRNIFILMNSSYYLVFIKIEQLHHGRMTELEQESNLTFKTK